jgi:AcrR family transcriptional regulator
MPVRSASGCRGTQIAEHLPAPTGQDARSGGPAAACLSVRHRVVLSAWPLLRGAVGELIVLIRLNNTCNEKNSRCSIPGVPNRKETLLDAAIVVLGERGMRALTHRAVDAEAGVAAGSTSNYFPTRESLLEAIVDRVSAMERGRFDEMATEVCPVTPAELGRSVAGWVREATGARRALTLSRYAILVEAGHNAKIRRQLAETGSRVNAWFANWLRLIGSVDTDRDVHVLGNYITGLMLHQLAMPDPAFDPADKITALLESLVQPAGTPRTELRTRQRD